MIKDCEGFKSLIEPWFTVQSAAPKRFAELVSALREYHRLRADNFKKPKGAASGGTSGAAPAAFLATKGKRGPCYVFQKYGECSRGDSCAYSHVKTGDTKADGGKPAARASGKSSGASKYLGSGPGLCFTMVNTGECSAGDSCPNKTSHKHMKALFHDSKTAGAKPGTHD